MNTPCYVQVNERNEVRGACLIKEYSDNQDWLRNASLVGDTVLQTTVERLRKLGDQIEMSMC